MSGNARIATLVLAAAAFCFALFLGAITAPAVRLSVSGAFAAASRGDIGAILALAGGLSVLTAAVTMMGSGWARIVLAVAAGLALGSLAPGVDGL